jgi:hypothetical protein
MKPNKRAFTDGWRFGAENKRTVTVRESSEYSRDTSDQIAYDEGSTDGANGDTWRLRGCCDCARNYNADGVPDEPCMAGIDRKSVKALIVHGEVRCEAFMKWTA